MANQFLKDPSPLDEKKSLGHYSKGLPHNASGVADPTLHSKLYTTLHHRHEEGLRDLTEGLVDANPDHRKLVAPSASMRSAINDTRGYQTRIPLAPDAYGQETADHYKHVAFWARNRDRTFEEIEADNPIEKTRTQSYAGARTGPFVSQFLLQPYYYGQSLIAPSYRRFAKKDYGTATDNFLAIQNGVKFNTQYVKAPGAPRTPRDLSAFVFADKDLQYLGALHYLVQNRYKCDPGWPFGHDDEGEAGFVDYGPPNLCRAVNDALYWGLKEAWRAKWDTRNLLLRPEAYAGILELLPEHLGDLAEELREDPDIKALHDKHGTYHLPLAFAVGSPLHPSFPAGHGLTAHAATAFVRMVIDEDQPMKVVMDFDADGKLVEVPNDGSITVGGELNKLAYNIAEARSMAGVHFGFDNYPLEYAENVAKFAFRRLTQSTALDSYVQYTTFAGDKTKLINN